MDYRSYLRIHEQITRERGAASNRMCSCGKRAKDWAWFHNTDPEDVYNYTPLCRSCHRKYDMTDEERNKLRKTSFAHGHTRNTGSKHPGSKLDEDDIIAIRAMYAEGKWTFVDVGSVFGVQGQTISKIIKGQLWSHV